MPCGHRSMCQACAQLFIEGKAEQRRCPICRQQVRAVGLRAGMLGAGGKGPAAALVRMVPLGMLHRLIPGHMPQIALQATATLRIFDP